MSSPSTNSLASFSQPYLNYQEKKTSNLLSPSKNINEINYLTPLYQLSIPISNQAQPDKETLEIYQALKRYSSSLSSNFYCDYKPPLEKSISSLLNIISESAPLKTQQAIKMFIQYSIKNNFEILFNNDFILSQLNKSESLTDYFINRIKIDFYETPFGSFILEVAKDYSYDIRLDQNNLDDLRKRFTNLEDKNDIEKLILDLNNMFGHSRNKFLDNMTVVYQLKGNKNETKEIKCKFKDKSWNDIFEKIGLNLAILFFNPCNFIGIALCIINASNPFGWVMLGLSLATTLAFNLALNEEENTTLKIKIPQNQIQDDEIKTLADICAKELKKPLESNYFMSKDIKDLEDKDKHQFFVQWIHNMNKDMQHYFNILKTPSNDTYNNFNLYPLSNVDYNNPIRT